MRIVIGTIGAGLTLVPGGLPPVGLGSAAELTLSPAGGSEPYRVTLLGSTLPDEWDVSIDGDGVVSITTAEAMLIGTYMLRFRVRDITRQPIIVVREVHVVPVFDPCADYVPEPEQNSALPMGDAPAEFGNITAPTGGALHLCNEVID